MSKDGKQVFTLTIMGRPTTKKRARTGMRKTKKGGWSRWATTPDDWYENMIREAFLKVYPYNKFKPFGWSKCIPNQDPSAYMWELEDGVKDTQLPKVQLDMIFYISGGKIGDADNYTKAVKDALNDYAYVDDRQIKHERPYVIYTGEYPEIEEEDLETFGEFAYIERVDILVRPFDLRKDAYFWKLRNFFKKRSTIVDLTLDYYNNYGGMKKDELIDTLELRGIPYEKYTKQEMIDLLIADDKKKAGVSNG